MTRVSILKHIWGGDGLSYFTTKFGFLKPQPQKWFRRVLRNPFRILFPLSSFYVYLVMINNKILWVNLRVLSLKLQLEIKHAMTWNDCNILLFIKDTIPHNEYVVIHCSPSWWCCFWLLFVFCFYKKCYSGLPWTWMIFYQGCKTNS